MKQYPIPTPDKNDFQEYIENHEYYDNDLQPLSFGEYKVAMARLHCVNALWDILYEQCTDDCIYPIELFDRLYKSKMVNLERRLGI